MPYLNPHVFYVYITGDLYEIPMASCSYAVGISNHDTLYVGEHMLDPIVAWLQARLQVGCLDMHPICFPIYFRRISTHPRAITWGSTKKDPEVTILLRTVQCSRLGHFSEKFIFKAT